MMKPENVFRIFAEINEVPRPSGHEEKISAYLQHFAVKHGLTYKTDETGNVLISKPATKGYENCKTVVLQAHQDMVCEKNADVSIDFMNDPIKTKVEGDWLMAQGTTLGADNGIGIAMALAVMADDSLEHGPLECLFTVDEERGLTGAMALQAGFMTGDILLNLDSEDEGQIFVGCAGGVRTSIKFGYVPQQLPDGFFYFEAEIVNGKGGHSGDDINKGLANANKELNHFLFKVMMEHNMVLCSFEGGGLHNAIPRQAKAVFAVPGSDKEKVRVMANLFDAELRAHYKDTDPNIELRVQSAEVTPALDTETSIKLIESIEAVHNGMYAMSRDIEGLVETSSNLASVKMKEEDVIEIVTSQRSSSKNGLIEVTNAVRAAFLLGGASVEVGDGYPGWEPNLKSEILAVAKSTYKELFGKEAEVKAIHAGLECGLFKERYPHMDMISFGPTLRGVHSPEERMLIPTVQKCWDHLVAILKAVPHK